MTRDPIGYSTRPINTPEVYKIELATTKGRLLLSRNFASQDEAQAYLKANLTEVQIKIKKQKGQDLIGYKIHEFLNIMQLNSQTLS